MALVEECTFIVSPLLPIPLRPSSGVERNSWHQLLLLLQQLIGVDHTRCIPLGLLGGQQVGTLTHVDKVGAECLGAGQEADAQAQAIQQADAQAQAG